MIDDRLFWSPPRPGRLPRNARCSGARRTAASAAHRRDQTPARSPLRPRTLVQPDARGVVLSARGGRPAPGRLTPRWRRLGRHRSPRDFRLPRHWGEGPAGTVGGEDIFQIAEVINGSPHIYGLWPHAASLFLRGYQIQSEPTDDRRAPSRGRKTKYRSISALGPRPRPIADRYALHAGHRRLGRRRVGVVRLTSISRPKTRSRSCVATSISDEPIATSKRLLVSAIARVEPTGFRWVDSWKREVADPGRPPFLQEPVAAHGRLAAQRKGAGLRPRQHGRPNRGGQARDASQGTTASRCDRRQDRGFPLGIGCRMIARSRQVFAGGTSIDCC